VVNVSNYSTISKPFETRKNLSCNQFNKHKIKQIEIYNHFWRSQELRMHRITLEI